VQTLTALLEAINRGGTEFCILSIEDTRLVMQVWNGDAYSPPVLFAFDKVDYLSLPPEFEASISVLSPGEAAGLCARHKLDSSCVIFIFSAREAIPTDGRPIQHHDGMLVHGEWVVRRVGWVSARALRVLS
jgi:hypothetical protein